MTHQDFKIKFWARNRKVRVICELKSITQAAQLLSVTVLWLVEVWTFSFWPLFSFWAINTSKTVRFEFFKVEIISTSKFPSAQVNETRTSALRSLQMSLEVWKLGVVTFWAPGDSPRLQNQILSPESESSSNLRAKKYNTSRTTPFRDRFMTGWSLNFFLLTSVQFLGHKYVKNSPIWVFQSGNHIYE